MRVAEVQLQRFVAAHVDVGEDPALPPYGERRARHAVEDDLESHPVAFAQPAGVGMNADRGCAHASRTRRTITVTSSCGSAPSRKARTSATTCSAHSRAERSRGSVPLSATRRSSPYCERTGRSAPPTPPLQPEH